MIFSCRPPFAPVEQLRIGPCGVTGLASGSTAPPVTLQQTQVR